MRLEPQSPPRALLQLVVKRRVPLRNRCEPRRFLIQKLQNNQKGQEVKIKIDSRYPEDVAFHLGTLPKSHFQLPPRFQRGFHGTASTKRRNAPEGATPMNAMMSFLDVICSCHLDIILDVILPMRCLFWSMLFNAKQQPNSCTDHVANMFFTTCDFGF